MLHGNPHIRQAVQRAIDEAEGRDPLDAAMRRAWERNFERNEKNVLWQALTLYAGTRREIENRALIAEYQSLRTLHPTEAYLRSQRFRQAESPFRPMDPDLVTDRSREEMLSDIVTNPLTYLLIVGAAYESAGSLALREIEALKAPGAAGRARVPWQYGNTGGVLGTTDKFGNITIQPGLTGKVLDETIRHEAVHRFFSPSPGVIGNVRADVGMAAYQQSHLVRYLEEGIAETYATGSLRQGLAYPISKGYVSGSRVFIEGVGYVTVTAGGVYIGYTLGNGGGQ